MTPAMQVLTVAFVGPLVICGIYTLIVMRCSNNPKPELHEPPVELAPVEWKRAA